MYWQIQAIIEELVGLAKERYIQRPRLTLAAGFIAALLLLRGTGCVAAAIFSTRHPETFAYQKVSGEIRYDDGFPIPVNGMLVCFVDRQSGQSLGCATVAGDGQFSTTVRMKTVGENGTGTAVTIASAAGDALATDVVPEEYASATSSPLTADLTKSPVEMRIRKP